MPYDAEYWNEYARSNESRYNANFAGFLRDLVSSLRCTSVLEAGCGTGIDLRLLGEGIAVHGADLNVEAIGAARERMPRADFRLCDVTDLPYEDASMDMVFTHRLLNYVDDATLEAAMSEMYRVAGRYIMSCETYRPDEALIDDPYRYRDMPRRWAAYDTTAVSNVDMHPEIDTCRFLLLKVPQRRAVP